MGTIWEEIIHWSRETSQANSKKTSLDRGESMQLSEEQKAIIAHEGNMRINAVAGSGKTTSVLEYARQRPQDPILYLAFNKSVRLQAQARFRAAGLKRVRVETAHSLAYQDIVRRYSYRVKRSDYTAYELSKLLNIQVKGGDALAKYLMANHVLGFTAYFCNSPVYKVKELNYLDTLRESGAQQFVQAHYAQIELLTRQFLAKMNSGEIPLTHDFYLKRYQLSQIKLPYKYLLFDEGQDASPAMLDVFKKQKGHKIIVGDAHQQIYSWRYAVNSLEQLDFPDFYLTNSFRFGKEIAQLANSVVEWKKHLHIESKVKIKGQGKSRSKQSVACLARTNLHLLVRAIEEVFIQKNIKNLYFEGNLNSYTYAAEGGSIWDVLSLKNENYQRIRDPLLKSMKSFEELEEYVEKTEESGLKMTLEIVKKYQNQLPYFLKELKNRQVDAEEREKADMIFSTVHRSKGLEYDQVFLGTDFMGEESLIQKAKESGNATERLKLAEEVNLLYVAITRAKNKLHFPEALLPLDRTVRTSKPKDKLQIIAEKKEKASAYPTAHSRASTRKMAKWSKEEERLLQEMFYEGIDPKVIARQLGRSMPAIQSRARKMRLF